MTALRHEEHFHWNPQVKEAASIPTSILIGSFRLEKTLEIINPNPNAICNYFVLLFNAIILHKISCYFVSIYHLSFQCAQHLRIHLMFVQVTFSAK